MAEGPADIHLATASGGEGPPDLFFVHATGFCKEVWGPVIDAIDAYPFAWRAMDLRGHGASDIGPFPHEWSQLGGDVLEAVESNHTAIGIGHSIGGTAIVRAEAQRPGTFERLVLIEPIIPPTRTGRFDGPMTLNARRRRAVFSSRNAARERYRSGPFSSWTDAALNAYLDGGFAESDEGVVLRCTPEVEADFFSEGWNHDTWELLPAIEAPVTLVATEYTDTHREPYLSALADRFRDVDLVVFEGASHLVPMEEPHRVASVIDGALALPSPP